MSKEHQGPAAPNPPPERGTERFEEARAQDHDLQQLHDALMREKQEPSERFMPTPLFLVLIISGFAFWAGIYLIKYSAGFDPYVYDETVVPGAALQSAGPAEFDPVAAGQRFFQRNCVVCHQADGNGVPGQYPPLVNSEWLQASAELPIRVLLNGMMGEIHVHGQSYNNVMPPFGQSKDRDIAAVLTYLRTASAFQNNSEAVSEEDVAAVRQALGGRTTPFNGAELEQEFLGK